MATRFPAPRRIDLLVLHCSATPDGRWVWPADVDRWHGDRGFRRQDEARRAYNPDFASLGYHWLILPNGGRPSGRHPLEVGAHARARGANHRSLGLCLIGTERYTAAAWDALADQVAFLCDKFKIPRRFAQASNGFTGVCGHRDLSPDLDGDGVVEPHEFLKTCPGFPVADWLAGGLEPLAGHLLEATPA